MNRITIYITLFIVAVTPMESYAQLKVRVTGVSNAQKDGLQIDRKEAILDAKRQAIEKAGVQIKSSTEVKNLMILEDYIETNAEAVLLPGYEIVDIGYDSDGVT